MVVERYMKNDTEKNVRLDNKSKHFASNNCKNDSKILELHPIYKCNLPSTFTSSAWNKLVPILPIFV